MLFVLDLAAELLRCSLSCRVSGAVMIYGLFLSFLSGSLVLTEAYCAENPMTKTIARNWENLCCVLANSRQRRRA